MIARLVLNLLKSHDIIAVLKRSTAFDAFPLWHTRIYLKVYGNSKCLETVNVSFDNSKPFSSVGLALPALDFTSIYLVTALPILHFIPRAKDVY